MTATYYGGSIPYVVRLSNELSHRQNHGGIFLIPVLHALECTSSLPSNPRVPEI